MWEDFTGARAAGRATSKMSSHAHRLQVSLPSRPNGFLPADLKSGGWFRRW